MRLLVTLIQTILLDSVYSFFDQFFIPREGLKPDINALALDKADNQDVDYFEYDYPGADVDYTDRQNSQSTKKKFNKTPRLPLPKLDDEVNTENVCLMYGVCATNADGYPASGKFVNCLNQTTPVALENEHLDIYKSLCPFQYQKYGGSTCCSPFQVEIMKNELTTAKQLLGRCPVCYYNFLSVVCAVSCHPNQSLFLKSVKYAYANDTLLLQEFEPVKDPNDVVISAIDFKVAASYADNLYNSCKNVQYQQINGPVVSGLMCGKYSEVCDGSNWLRFTGSLETTQTPFPINYIFTNDSDPETWDPRKDGSNIGPCHELMDLNGFQIQGKVFKLNNSD